MKTKLLNSMRVLLVAAGLCVGAGNAWAQDEVYNFQAFVNNSNAGNTYELSLGESSGVTVDGQDMFYMKDFTQANYSNQKSTSYEFSANSRLACRGSNAFRFHKPNQGVAIYCNTANSYLTVLNLNVGDTIVITEKEQRSDIVFYSTNVKKAGEDTNVSSLDVITTGQKYVVTEGNDAHLDIKFTATWAGFYKIEIYLNKEIETVTAPSITTVSAYNAQRTVTLTGGSSSAKDATVSYRYTTDGTVPTAESTPYDEEKKIVIDETKTIKAITVSSTGKTSAVSTSVVSAGSNIQLKAPTYSVTNMYGTGAYFPMIKGSADNTSLIGKPSATLTYTLDGEALTPVDNVVTCPHAGTLTITASCDGYDSKSTEVAVKAYSKTAEIDFGAIDEESLNKTYWGSRTENANYSKGNGQADVVYTSTSYTVVSDYITNLAIEGMNLAAGWKILLGYGVYPDGANTSISVYGAAANQYVRWTVNTYGSDGVAMTSGTGGWKPANAWRGMAKKVEVFGELSPVAATVTSSTGYATFCSPYALDFTGIEDVTAWVATAIGTETVTMEQVNGTVKAGTGLVIKGSTTNIPVVADGTDYSATNKLVGVTEGSVSPESGYVLSVQDGKAVFAPIDDVKPTVTAGHAYLSAGANARTLRISFGADDTTGITAVEDKVASDTVYTLSGQRVAHPAKGLYIVGGKKVILK